jgi:hypothetical protein
MCVKFSVAIGELEGAEEYLFGQISGLAVDSEGHIHVADPQAKEIRVFRRRASSSAWGGTGRGPVSSVTSAG